MKKKILVEFALIISLVLTMCSGCKASECTDDGYAEYKPVFGNPKARSRAEMYIIDESRVDVEHYKRIQFVFAFYKIKYKLIDNKVMVDCDVWKNKDYMMNMTTKADKDLVAAQCRSIREDFNKFKRDIYGNTQTLLEMCNSMSL